MRCPPLPCSPPARSPVTGPGGPFDNGCRRFAAVDRITRSSRARVRPHHAGQVRPLRPQRPIVRGRGGDRFVTDHDQARPARGHTRDRADTTTRSTSEKDTGPPCPPTSRGSLSASAETPPHNPRSVRLAADCRDAASRPHRRRRARGCLSVANTLSDAGLNCHHPGAPGSMPNRCVTNLSAVVPSARRFIQLWVSVPTGSMFPGVHHSLGLDVGRRRWRSAKMLGRAYQGGATLLCKYGARDGTLGL